ncbi:MAG: ATP cone domain-containing protein [Candidatus Methanomethylicia archaeon]
MVLKVVKRDGRIEEFAREKLVTSLLKAGVDLTTARELTGRIEGEFTGREEVKTEELRTRVLELLKENNVKAYENWIVYDRAVKKRLT